MDQRKTQIQILEQEWAQDRWKEVKRGYTAEDVVRLRGSLRIEHTLAQKAPRSCGRFATSAHSYIPSAP